MRIKYLLVIFFLMFYVFSSAQVESGYLLKCFRSNLLNDSTEDDLAFAFFLPAVDFESSNFDSLMIEDKDEGMDAYFSKEFLSLLQFKAYLIMTAPTRTHIKDRICELGKPIVLKNDFDSNGLKFVIRISDDYYYKIYSSKTQVSFCRMSKYSEFESLFKEVIVLNRLPVYGKMLDWEKVKFNDAFSRINIHEP